MAQQIFPTKGNLIAVKKSLALSSLGFDLMDKKRSILIRELMGLIEKSKMIREQIKTTYDTAYLSLQRANISLGVIDDIAEAVPIENGIEMTFRSVMGVDVPIIHYEEKPITLSYGIIDSNSQLDEAYRCFQKVKNLTIILAEVENSIYRLAKAIVKTQKRANALQNIVIPRFKKAQKFISDSLEEKDREEFSRLKVIKTQKTKKELLKETENN